MPRFLVHIAQNLIYAFPAAETNAPTGLWTFQLHFRRVAMIPSADARQRAQEHLGGFPPAVVEAYFAFAEHGDPARLDEVVLGVLQFYLAKPPPVPVEALPGSTRLAADLGCDSLTMIDMVFLAEGLFGVRLSDDELARIVTLDDLREHFRQRVVRDRATAA